MREKKRRKLTVKTVLIAFSSMEIGLKGKEMGCISLSVGSVLHECLNQYLH